MKSWHKSALASVAALALVGGAYLIGVTFYTGMWMPVVFGALVTTLVTARMKDTAERRWALRHANHAHIFIGVFFTFAALGPVIVLAMMPTKTPGMALATSVFAGVIASGWAASSIYRAWWAVPLLLAFQVVFTIPYFDNGHRLGVYSIGEGIPERWRLVLLMGMSALCVVVGYVYTLMYVRGVTAKAATASAELDMAKEIHERVVPPVKEDFGLAEVFGRSHPSSEMGGDLLDVTLRDGVLDVYLADVSGHGVKAGLVMGMVKSAIRMRQRSTPSLDVMVSDLNAVLTDLMMSDMFATLACVRLTRRGEQTTAEYALAGHWPILHISAAGVLTELPNEHLPLGVDSEELFHSGMVNLRSGDLLVLMTDGLIEVQNTTGNELGFTPFKDVIVRERAQSLARIHDVVMELARAHGKQLDDQSLVVVRVK